MTAFAVDVREMNETEVDLVTGGVNWYAAARLAGHAIRLGAVGGAAGLVAAGVVVGGALVIDYALDGEMDLLK